MDATVLRGLLGDAYALARTLYQNSAPEEVQVAVSMAPRSDRARYHRPGCQHFKVPDEERVTVKRKAAEQSGAVPCTYCGDLTLRAWCRELDLDVTQVWQVLNNHQARLQREVFLRLMKAIGERPHPSLIAS